jgi:hypothetical protein
MATNIEAKIPSYLQDDCAAGLPDFSLCNIPDGKKTPNDQKIYQN